MFGTENRRKWSINETLQEHAVFLFMADGVFSLSSNLCFISKLLINLLQHPLHHSYFRLTFTGSWCCYFKNKHKASFVWIHRKSNSSKHFCNTHPHWRKPQMQMSCTHKTGCTAGVRICFHDLSICKSPRNPSGESRKHPYPPLLQIILWTPTCHDLHFPSCDCTPWANTSKQLRDDSRQPGSSRHPLIQQLERRPERWNTCSINGNGTGSPDHQWYS